VQDALGGSVPPDRLTLDDPAVAVAVPTHVLDSAFGVATTKPAGNMSVNATPGNPVVAFGLVIEKVKLVVPPTGIDAAPKALAMLGGATSALAGRAITRVAALASTSPSSPSRAQSPNLIPPPHLSARSPAANRAAISRGDYREQRSSGRGASPRACIRARSPSPPGAVLVGRSDVAARREAPVPHPGHPVPPASRRGEDC
jgi:hypothetical protein